MNHNRPAPASRRVDAAHFWGAWTRLAGLACCCGWRIVLLLVFTGLAAHGQEGGIISGVVVGTWDGNPLPSVVVTVRGTTLAVQTDAQGRYQVMNVPAGDQVVRFFKPGYATAVVSDVHVLTGQATTVNGNLRPEFYELEEYEVTAEEFTEQTEKILIERQKSSSMMEALGSDFLARVGAGNAAESISKVSGASLVEGKFAVIRGLNDRYVTTTLNGASIPSADPYRQSASLDMFPSQVIDRVVVSKTFTPDQPGTFTGGGIDIVTRSFPDKPFASVSVGTAFNTQASLNDNFLTYKGGAFDWAAIDDGTRALPGEVSGTVPTPPARNGRPGRPNYDPNIADQVLRLDGLTRAMGVPQFAPDREAPGLDHNFSVAVGGATNLFGRPFGYFAGLTYKHDFSSYDRGVSRRQANLPSGTIIERSFFRDARSLSLVNWDGMVNLAYKPLENHELDFTFLYNQNGSDEARVQDEGIRSEDTGASFRQFRLYYTERNLNTYQIKGSHLLPDVANLKFDWLVALTQTTQDEPDVRFFNDVSHGGPFETGVNSLPDPQNPTRYFRNLEENNRNVKLDWTLPFHHWTDAEANVKFGLFDSLSDRTFLDREIYYQGDAPYNGDPNAFITPELLDQLYGVRTNVNSISYDWNRYIQARESAYDGHLEVQAAYLMLELPIVERVRLVGGVRLETTDLQVSSRSYRANSVTGRATNSVSLPQTDVLPSAGLIYNLTPNMNLRLSYSQTIARPTFRELAGYFSYDPVLDDMLDGNPRLTMSSIDNYDVRWEWFPKPGELLSFSFFYKDLKNAIERRYLKVDAEQISFINRPSANLVGLEFEARKNLDFLGPPMKDFSLGGNLSLVQSEVELTPEELFNKRNYLPGTKSTRPLYDQSPYILNLDLSYNNTRSGTTASIIFNLAGPRVSIASLNSDDVYEQPAPSVDFVFSQRIRQNLKVKFAARNLLDPLIERTYGEKGGPLYSSYTKGRVFGLSLNYDF
ncbi:MAG: TonB-dependent receptor [Verrucomicrobiota bacterium]